MIILQINELTASVKTLGIAGTLIVTFLLACYGLFQYFTGRLDKKDDILLKQLDRKDELLLKQMEERHMDVLRIERFMDNSTKGQEKIAEALTSLANELRRGS